MSSRKKKNTSTYCPCLRLLASLASVRSSGSTASAEDNRTFEKWTILAKGAESAKSWEIWKISQSIRSYYLLYHFFQHLLLALLHALWLQVQIILQPAHAFGHSADKTSMQRPSLPRGKTSDHLCSLLGSEHCVGQIDGSTFWTGGCLGKNGKVKSWLVVCSCKNPRNQHSGWL